MESEAKNPHGICLADTGAVIGWACGTCWEIYFVSNPYPQIIAELELIARFCCSHPCWKCHGNAERGQLLCVTCQKGVGIAATSRARSASPFPTGDATITAPPSTVGAISSPDGAEGVKVLSLRQPWANAVLLLGKNIENRRWNTTHRGEFLIHAAKAMTAREHAEAMAFCEDVLGVGHTVEIVEALGRWGATIPLCFGGIVGKARLVDVVRPRPNTILGGDEAHYPEGLRGDGGWRWHMPEQYGFVLEDIKPLPFIPCKGALNFFGAPFAVREAIGLGSSAGAEA